ncbi:MAG TPA: PQQ-binding-like beta-propeller repeat protein [Acidimicrobiales bacterium]|nr:PQQ-binding-like beta-propeller repeat protein [Acidimicrobiales bacterium]
MAVLLVAAVVVGLVIDRTVFSSSSHPPKAQALSAVTHHPKKTSIPAVESGLLPWQLAAPISRVVVLPGAGSQLDILGGLTSNNTSSSGIYTLDTSNGALRQIGNLSGPLHDAAGAVSGGQDVVFGGGVSATVATVQTFPHSAGASGSPATQGPTATVVSSLPGPRSDAADVAIGSTNYLVGGYDGTNPDAVVLATTDDRTFRSVAPLPVPVRYPAAAALDGKIYVFGGQAILGVSAGNPVSTIQMIDPVHHTASVVGHLPEPLSGATAVTLAGHVYLIGGESTSAQPTTAGIGSTQTTTTGSGTNPGVGASGATPDRYETNGHNRAAAEVLTAAVAPAPTNTVAGVWAFDPASLRLISAGHLQVPVSHAGVAILGTTAWIIGGESNGTPVATAQMVTPDAAFGVAGAPGAGSPYFGAKLLIADRGNNRLLVMDPSMNVLWTYPSSTSPPDPLGFYFPDDAFFINKGTAIISNQEQNETIVEIGYPSGKILWSYGHPKQASAASGYLHEPDDAFLLKNGQITVADAQNCRVLVLNADGTLAHQIGTNGVCVHNPPLSMGSPNGDTPLADGNLLVSEINGSWVSEYTPQGKLVWTVQLPISYPSDPQQIGPDLYLIADYASPGQVLEFNRAGQILYRHDVTSGPGMLNHPSLAELLPSGVIMVNDDYRNRMMAFDPKTGALVWQYGINDHAGTTPGMLNTPDGFDLLLPDGSTPTHPATG